jgi:hypothetical protein
MGIKGSRRLLFLLESSSQKAFSGGVSVAGFRVPTDHLGDNFMRKDANVLTQRKQVNDRTFDVPVVVDDVKRYGKFKMTRCTYFTIECDAPSSNWVLELGKKSIPFLLIGLSGLIVRPIGGGRLFESSDSIDELFKTIESDPSLYVDINDLWLPNKLFQGLPHRGEVYRVGSRLFHVAYLCREERISEDQFFRQCSELKSLIRLSKKETRSFASWSRLQIERARDSYPKSKGLELKWR